ncbi:MAG: nicotinate phosphoribosyltransferase [Alphaproteobacteria bacterium]|nr:nicotinate phosphoribosyltransferase [Alphaproteobacteria bacterium]
MDHQSYLQCGHLPEAADIPHQLSDWSDSYFGRTRQIVEHYGDARVKQAVFMRRPVVFAPKLCFAFLEAVAAAKGAEIKITPLTEEGKWVGAGSPLFTLEGQFSLLLECETRMLQRIGATCVAAYSAYAMCAELPDTGFLAMEARHCAGTEMSDLMSYAASVGGARAQRKAQAKGFIGGSCRASAGYFGQSNGLGTMPHSLVGYAGSTVRAAEMFHATFPEAPITVLVDFFGREITDSFAVCAALPELAYSGRLSVRLDTHGGRFCEGLDTALSYQTLERHVPFAIKGYRSESELKYMIGTGVSAACIWHVREKLDAAGYPNVEIVASSGFTPEKCRVMAITQAPVDVIGTGSFIPALWNETFATCDVIEFDGRAVVKQGREFLLDAVNAAQGR